MAHLKSDAVWGGKAPLSAEERWDWLFSGEYGRHLSTPLRLVGPRRLAHFRTIYCISGSLSV